MTFYEKFVQPVLQNQIATGLSATAVMGFIFYELRSFPNYIKNLFERFFIVRLRVFNSDPAFTWLELWLAAHPYTSSAKSVMLKSYGHDGSFVSEDDNSKVEWALSPGLGLHWFWWRGRLIWLDRTKGDLPTPSEGVRRSTGIIETIEVFTFGRSQKILREIVAESHSIMLKKNIIAIKLWRGWWMAVRGKSPRALSTIVLAQGQQERIRADIDKFLASREWYSKRGIPWRRGYLLSGPPGTGKTSYVLALAAALKRPLCVLNLGSIHNDDSLFSAMMDAPFNAIILIEDIDCARASEKRAPASPEKGVPIAHTGAPKKSDDDEESGITKAGLLNALDGVTTPDGRILIMTTNHPEMLDPALIRPGRADFHEVFDLLDEEGQSRMAELYYPKRAFKPIDWQRISPAHLQKAFMLFPNDAKAARQFLIDEDKK